MAYSKDEIALIVKEVLQQSGQQGTQQTAQQNAQDIAEAVQQVLGSQQEKTSFSSQENKQEEINSGEAHRASVLSQTRVWNHNDKYLVEKSQDYDRSLKALEIKEKQLAVDEREAKLRQQSKLDSIELSERSNLAFVTHLANTLSLDFRQASYHPISPNDQDKDATSEG